MTGNRPPLPEHVKKHYGDEFDLIVTNPTVEPDQIGRLGLLHLSVDKSCCVVLTVDTPTGFGTYTPFDVTVTDVDRLIDLLRAAQQAARTKFEEAVQ